MACHPSQPTGRQVSHAVGFVMIRGLQELYRHRCHEGGNLNEHLPLLYMPRWRVTGGGVWHRSGNLDERGSWQGRRSVLCVAGPLPTLGVDINVVCEAEVQRLW